MIILVLNSSTPQRLDGRQTRWWLAALDFPPAARVRQALPTRRPAVRPDSTHWSQGEEPSGIKATYASTSSTLTSERSTAPHGPVRSRATNRLQPGARNLFRFNAAHGLASAARGSFAQRSGLEPARRFFHPPVFEKMNCSNSSDPRLSSQ